jgi:hypothetical protein
VLCCFTNPFLKMTKPRSNSTVAEQRAVIRFCGHKTLTRLKPTIRNKCRRLLSKGVPLVQDKARLPFEAADI